MVATCRTITGDLGAITPPSSDRKAPGWIIPLENDWTSVLDCAGIGVTINTSTWNIHPDDDDGSVTFSQQTINGLVTRAMVAGGTDGKLYRVQNNVTASDGVTIVATISLPVLETRALNA